MDLVEYCISHRLVSLIPMKDIEKYTDSSICGWRGLHIIAKYGTDEMRWKIIHTSDQDVLAQIVVHGNDQHRDYIISHSLNFNQDLICAFLMFGNDKHREVFRTTVMAGSYNVPIINLPMLVESYPNVFK